MQKLQKVNFQKADDDKAYSPDDDNDEDDNGDDDDDVVQLRTGLASLDQTPTATGEGMTSSEASGSKKELDLEVAMHLLVSINPYGSR